MEVIVVLMVVTLSIFFRVFIISQWDRDRINDDAKSKGWVVSSIVWEPFGPGWFGEKNDRIYSVSYMNAKGKKVNQFCKTSMLSGVYWK